MEKFWWLALMLFEMRIVRYLRELKDLAQAFGAPGLFLVALLDSAFVPIPGGPDALMVTNSINTTPLGLVKFVLAATIASTIGCTILYMIAQRGGAKVLEKISVEKRDYVQNMLGRYDAFAIVLACIMPPPFPFKPFILMSGVIRFKLPRFIVALLIGRGLRFTLLGLLALYYGEATLKLIGKYGPYILLSLVVIGLAFWLFKRFTRKTDDAQKSAE